MCEPSQRKALGKSLYKSLTEREMGLLASSKTIADIVSEYEKELASLDVEDFNDPKRVLDVPRASSCYLNHLKISSIQKDIPKLKLSLERIRVDDNYKLTSQKLLDLQRLVDEKEFMNNKVLNLWLERQTTAIDVQQTPYNDTGETIDAEQQVRDLEEPALEDNNLTSLRQRLLAGGTYTSLDSESMEKSNETHESIQEDIIHEISGFATSLKDSALRLSSKILEDQNILHRTNENVLKSESLMKTVGNNLNDYINNKTGGKISFWFLIKAFAGTMLLFFMMVLIIKIFPAF